MSRRGLALASGWRRGLTLGGLRRGRAAGDSFTGILDELSVAPILALSTRRLSSGFTGDIATIRETGANGEDSFSYTGDPPTLDFAAINAFIGANNGRWKGWQNQVSGGSAAQTVQASQPLYVNGAGPDFGTAAQAYYFTVAHAANQLLTGGFTIATRIRVDTSGESSAGRIVDKSSGSNGTNGFILYTAGSGGIGAIVNNGTVVASSSVSTGTMLNLVCTVSAAGAVSFYLNNVAHGTGTTSACSGITTTNDLAVGYSTALAGRHLDGMIESLLIFPGVVGSSDLAALNTWLG